MIMNASSSVATTMIGRQRIGQDVAEQQAHRAVAARPGAAHELALADRQHVGADDPRELHPAGDGHHQDHVQEARAEREDDPHREQDIGDGEEDIRHAHDERVGAAPVEAGQEAERDADQAGERDRRESDAEGDPAPVDDAAQDVAPEVIGAERMLREATRLPGRGPEALGEHLPPRVPRGDLRGRQRRATHEEKHRDPEDGAEAHSAADRGGDRPGEGHRRRARGLAHCLLRTKTMRGSR